MRLSSSAAAELLGPGPPDSVGIADVVMEFDADEAVDMPSELVAVTVKVYAVEADWCSGNPRRQATSILH